MEKKIVMKVLSALLFNAVMGALLFHLMGFEAQQIFPVAN